MSIRLFVLNIIFLVILTACGLGPIKREDPQSKLPVIYAPTRISADIAKAMILRGFKGGTTCDKRIGTEFKFDTVEREQDYLKLHGMLKSYDLPGQPSTPELVTNVTGTFNLNSGIIDLKSVKEAPSKVIAHDIWGHEYGFLSGEDPITRWFTNKSAKNDAELYNRSQFALYAVTNIRHDALTGSLVSTSMNCVEITLKPNDTSGLGAIPSVTVDNATWLANVTDVSTNFFVTEGNNVTQISPQSIPSAHFYWLQVAAELGDDDAIALVGHAYEEGLGVKINYKLAVKYFLMAAERGDARAQDELATIYAKGIGIPPDIARSEYWKKKANATQLQASKVCTSDQALTAETEMLIAAQNDPTVRLAEMALGMVSGFKINNGTSRIVSVSAGSVATMDRPFLCNVYAMHVGTSFVNIKPRWEYYGTDINGVRYDIDQRAESELNGMIAQTGNSIVNKFPFQQTFRVQPINYNHFKLTMKEGLTKHEYTSIIEIH